MTRTVYVRLLNEGVAVSRPVEGLEVQAGLYELQPIVDYATSGEIWEFPPGSLVRIIEQCSSSEGTYFIAVSDSKREAE